MNECDAILRLCRCCGELLPIDDFDPLGKLCRGCFYSGGYKATGRIARSRGVVITEKGHELLREMKRVKAA